ncbi:MAG: FAD-binding protein [Kineosporiaceae bacterium]|nr:FAD-binding protein [Kineosporiaceae bacterium]
MVAALSRAGVEVSAGVGDRARYSSDASLYRVAPRAVSFPRTTDHLIGAVETCRALGVPVTLRGAGTSIAGNAVGPGLVIDTSRHLNRVLSVDAESRTARVQPGCVLATLQSTAAANRLRFGPDPSTHNRATLGGMIGNNACGSRALGYGRTADNVVDLDVVTGSGQVLRAGSVSSGTSAAPAGLADRLSALVAGNLATIRTEFGRFGRQVSGYSLEHLLPERGASLARFLVGTEGTLAVVTEATVRLVEAPAHTVLVVLGYPDMAGAADAVPALLDLRPVAVEGLDARIVDVVRAQRSAHGGGPIPELPTGTGWLMVELAGGSPAELLSRANALVGVAGALGSRIVESAAETAALWRIREDGAGLSARSPRGRAAHAGWEDSAVPPERLGDYLRAFETLMATHDLTGVPYGHFGDGCLHIRLDLPLDGREGRTALRSFLTDAAELVAAHGGSMSGEHGDGRARSELLPRMYSPAALALFADVKDIFDPDGVLNPGIVVRPQPVDADLRLAQRISPHRIAAEVHRCTGVGKCRADTTASGGVMCPSYLATRDEKDSTRGRARVLQEMVNGSLVTGGWRAPEVHEALELCLSCKGCASDCPTGIDLAAYKSLVLHQAYRGRIRPMDHYALGWLPLWARLATASPRLARTANRLLAQGSVARTVKRLGRIDARRPLPSFATTTFRQWFANHSPPQSGGGRGVLLWVDTFTNHFSPEVGIAAVRVLQSAGFTVQLTDRDECCGLTWISTGQRSVARRLLTRSVEALEGVAAREIPIVGLEPSCTAVFRDEAAELVGRTVRVHTLAELLAEVDPGLLPRLDDVSAVAQPHCHQHAVMGYEADRALLAAVGASVRTVGGCCGLAGNFGVVEGHYDVSVAVAETALLPALRDQDASGTALADGFSCRTQIEALTGRRALHLAEVLAERLPSGTVRQAP